VDFRQQHRWTSASLRLGSGWGLPDFSPNLSLYEMRTLVMTPCTILMAEQKARPWLSPWLSLWPLPELVLVVLLPWPSSNSNDDQDNKLLHD
jgi:hypothetical protein